MPSESASEKKGTRVVDFNVKGKLSEEEKEIMYNLMCRLEEPTPDSELIALRQSNGGEEFTFVRLPDTEGT